MIKVVHLTENPIAGAPMNLARAQNKWQGDKISARHIAASDRNEKRVYDSDLLTGVHPYEEIRNVLESASVLHFHNFYRSQELFRKYPDLWDIARRKPRVWQVHSQRSIKWMPITEGLEDPAAKHLVIGQYHPREWPECEVVPNIVDITEPRLMPKTRVWNRPLHVVYSPSRTGLMGWDNKGYNETHPILERYNKTGKLTAEIIRDVSYEECLLRRGLGHISIDEIVTGSYHLVSLESLSQGLVTIAGLDELQVETLKKLTGASWHPWVKATPDTLAHRLETCIQDPALVKIVAEDGRKWMERYWHPRDMTKRFLEIYERL